MHVNQKELAECIGITAREIRNLRQQGMFAQMPETRKYDLSKCVREYIDFKIKAETGRGTVLIKERVQAEHEEIKKQISLLKLRRLKRQLHAATDVEDFLNNMLINFRNRLLDLPPKIAMTIKGEEDTNIITRMVKEYLFEALENLSQYDPEKIDRIELEQIEDEAEDEGEPDEQETG